MAFKPFDLTGKVALVTGGNGGIGLGMAEGLAAAGARIAIWGQNPDKNARAEAALRAHGVDVLVQRVDVADEAAIEQGVAGVIAPGLGVGGPGGQPAQLVEAPAAWGISTPIWLAIAGVLTGFGTKIGNGCTSGHGICGLARLSVRSVAAVVVFFAVAVLTVAVTGIV